MNILFRADASAEIGSGHLMRCLGLAQYLRDEGAFCSLLTRTAEKEPVLTRWREEEINIETHQAARGSLKDAEATLAVAADIGTQWIVADGYDFSLNWQRAVKEGGARLVCFDDLGGATVAADLVVNQNPGAQDLSYNTEGGQVLAGTDYVVLRRDLRRLKREASSQPPHLLATFGGYDEDNLALAAMKELTRLETPFSATVICAADTRGLEEAKAFAASHGETFRILPPGDILPLMAAADLALCAGGTTSLELASLGAPMVLVTVADNQEPGAAALAGAGCACLAGRGVGALGAAAKLLDDLLRDSSAREEMSRAGTTLVDGRGAARISEAMQEING